MKRFLIVAMLLSLTAALALADSPNTKTYKMHSGSGYFLRNCELDFDKGSLLIERHGRQGIKVEITQEYELYVDDKLIETDAEQHKLVVQTYDGSMELVDLAKEIGLEGASIGIDGAKLGLKAVGGVFKMIFTSYDQDDLEDEMERESDKLEKRADKLEKRATKIEAMVDELEIVFQDMVNRVPALEPLR